MDCVASVHCSDSPLIKAMSRLVPPELGQLHLSPDGRGQLVALHLTAVTLFMEVSGRRLGRARTLLRVWPSFVGRDDR